MKIPLFIILSLFAFCSRSQNFMMRMDVMEVLEDTTYRLDSLNVIWGIHGREIHFLYNDKIVKFNKMAYAKYKNRAVRKQIEEFILQQKSQAFNKNLRVRDVYYNQWGEMFLITIYMGDTTLIWISRIGDKYPYYSFNMI